MSGGDRTQEGGTAPAEAVEHRDTPAGPVALLLAGLVGLLLVVCAAVAGMLILFDRAAPPPAPPPPEVLTPPEPRLQLHEPVQRRRLEAEAGAARPAIEAAMARTARGGWGDGR